MGTTVEALTIAVNFTIRGTIRTAGAAALQRLRNCVCGCNVKAKNTLYMNYLPMARNSGATILRRPKRSGWRNSPAADGGFTANT
jgi:hypothetical protein